MKSFIEKLKAALRKAAQTSAGPLIAGLAAGAVLIAGIVAMQPPKVMAQIAATGPSLTQVGGQVQPRTYVVFSELSVSNTSIFTNGNFAITPALTNLLGTNDLNGLTFLTNVSPYWWFPSFLPASQSKTLGLTAIIHNTNVFVHSSNIVVSVFEALDTLGAASGTAAPHYGQLFGSAPIATWTITYTGNLVAVTNITVPAWEPATAFGISLSDGSTATASGPSSNKLVSLIASITP